MLQTNSGIDDDWIAFEPNHYSFCEKQQKVGSESTGSLGNRLDQLTSMYENLVNNSKHVISKLCFLLIKFIPHDSNIKQAFSFIQKMQEGWKHFNNRDDNCSTIVDRLQSNYKVESKKQHKFRTKLGNQQIKIQPIANASNLIKSQVSTHNFYTPLSQVRQNTMQTHSKKFIDGYSINILDSEQQTPAKSISQPHYKIKLKDEFYHIRQFVLFWLYPRLEVHQDKILQKKMIVNCYFAWNRRVKRQIQISETSKLQMELTVQIKLKVPSAESKFRIFKGVGFKEQYMRQMNITDYEPKTGGREHELCCEGNSNMDPLDEILMLARRQKKENIVPFNEQKMAALDRALGLI